jgi:hypothetical protein
MVRLLNWKSSDRSYRFSLGIFHDDQVNCISINADICIFVLSGPKSNTMKDFWQMIWQGQVDKIVMVELH